MFKDNGMNLFGVVRCLAVAIEEMCMNDVITRPEILTSYTKKEITRCRQVFDEAVGMFGRVGVREDYDTVI